MSKVRPVVGTRRAVTKITFPLPDELSILKIQDVVVETVKGVTLDIGSCCYLQREYGKRQQGFGFGVDEKTLCPLRVQFISEAMVLFRTMNKKYRVGTLHHYIRALVEFFNWCDSTAKHDFIANEQKLRLNFRSYVEHLSDESAQHKKTPTVVRRSACQLETVLQGLTGIDDLKRGVKIPRRMYGDGVPPSLPEESAQEKTIAWSKALLWGLSKLVLEHERYPYPLTIPSYMGVADNTLWLFPMLTWCISPGELATKKSTHIDYVNGKIRTREEIVAAGNGWHAGNNRKALNYIETSNADPRSPPRIRRAMLAFHAGLMLFSANSGINATQIFEMEWDEDFELALLKPETHRIKFRVIKARAHGMELNFQCGPEFLQEFKKVLKLRHYLLNGQHFHKLFFSFGIDPEAGIPRALSPTAFTDFAACLNRLDPTLVAVLPRQWRAAQHEHKARAFDPLTAAISAQHSPATADQYYKRGSETIHYEEMDAYFSAWRRSRERQAQSRVEVEQRAIGGCSSPNNPLAFITEPAVEPTCANDGGCLFCENYVVEPNELGVQKLFSARYYLREMNAVNELTKIKLSDRIAFLIQEVRKIAPDIVDIGEANVDDGHVLTSYWRAKVNLCIKLEN